MSELVQVAILVLVSVLAARMTRLDQVISRFLPFVAMGSAVVLPLALWGNASWPMTAAVVAALVCTAVATLLFVFLCGWTMYQATHVLTDSQTTEYAQEREADAKEIAATAVAAGDPEAASGFFALHTAGAVAGVMMTTCLMLVLTGLNLVALTLASFLQARFVYSLSTPWSLLVVLIILFATQPLVGASLAVGLAHADQVPMSDKAPSLRE